MTKLKRALSSALAFVMMVGCVTVLNVSSVLAASNSAKVALYSPTVTGDTSVITYKSSLAEAVNEAPYGYYVNLLLDDASTDKIVVDKALVIDLNTHSFSGTIEAAPGYKIGTTDTNSEGKTNYYQIVPVFSVPKLTSSLGWNGSDFTLNFKLEDGFTREDGITYGITVATQEGKEEKYTLESTQDGIALSCSSNNNFSNVPFTVCATATGADGSNATVTSDGLPIYYQAIYSLVVASIMNSTFTEGEVIEAAQLAKANEVLNKGGIYLDFDTDDLLSEATKDIMELVITESDDYTTVTCTVTLKDKAYNAGLRLNSDIAVTLEGGDETINYTEKTVDESGKVVTITAPTE